MAEHSLAVSGARGCGVSGDGSRDVRVSVAVPEGVVAVRDLNTHLLLWQHKVLDAQFVVFFFKGIVFLLVWFSLTGNKFHNFILPRQSAKKV